MEHKNENSNMKKEEDTLSNIILTNPTIIDFFQRNQNINVVQVLLEFIKKYQRDILKTDENVHYINKYVLEDIIKENQQNTLYVDTVIGIVKDSNKKLLELLEKNKSTSLEQYIQSVTYSSPHELKNQLRCDLCKYFITTNRRALSAHQRGCKKYVGSY